MSCNPSIGGVGKGTLVREIDAMGGLMGKVADRSGINFKVLNASKGAAVQGPRAQMDRDIYKENMQKALFDSRYSDRNDRDNLALYEGNVHDLIIEQDGTCGGIVMSDGTELRASAVVLTAGTFLGGEVFIGDSERFSAGRFMRHSDKDKDDKIKIEPASQALS